MDDYLPMPRHLVEVVTGTMTDEEWLKHTQEQYRKFKELHPEHEFIAESIESEIQPQIEPVQLQENVDQPSVQPLNPLIMDEQPDLREDSEEPKPNSYPIDPSLLFNEQNNHELELLAYRDFLNLNKEMDDESWKVWWNQYVMTLYQGLNHAKYQNTGEIQDALHRLFWDLYHQTQPSSKIDLPAPLLSGQLKLVTITDWFNHLNELLAVVMNQGSLVILITQYDFNLNRVEIVFSKKTALSDLFVHQPVSNGSKEVNVFDYWFTNKQRKTYTSLQFAPGIETPDYVYNLWQGYGFKPCPLGSWRLLKEHILNIIANGNQEIYDYVLDWMADTVQLNPDKPGVAIVLIGKKGSGKGILASSFGKLFGRHFIHLISSNQLTGHFNMHFKDVLLAFADEAFWRGDKDAEGCLKGLITETDLLIEPKYVNSFMVKSYTRLILSSNNPWVVPSSEDERRYLVLQVSDKEIGNIAYFKAIQEQLDNGGNEAMLDELLHRDLSASNLRVPPRTQALSDQIYQTDLVLQFLIQCIEEQSLYRLNGVPQPWNNGVVLTLTFQAEFDAFVKQRGKHYAYIGNTLGKSLRRWLAENDANIAATDCISHGKTRMDIEGTGDKRQKPCYNFKSIAECKAMIDKKLKTPWTWTEHEDDDPKDNDTL